MLTSCRGLALSFAFALVASFSSVACGGASGEPAQDPSTASTASADAGAATAAAPTAAAMATPAAAAPVSLQAQIDSGEKIYKSKCASCHGSKGEGDGETPAVAGAKSLPIAPPAGAKIRKGEFKNADDVAAFVKKAMPIDDPGSLSAADAYAVTAWELSLTGSQLGGKALDASDASSIVVHPR